MPKDKFIAALKESLQDNHFIKLNLGNYQGQEMGLKKLLIKKVIIKKREKLSFVYQYQTKDITKNYKLEEGLSLLEGLINISAFRHANLFTLPKDHELQILKNGAWKLSEKSASLNALPDVQHDKRKNRKIDTIGKEYLYELKITDQKGNVRPHGQDKFKQINHYIEILSSLLKELPTKDRTTIVDMGSGKGYLTFALYDYLTNNLNQATTITGVEFRTDLVRLCNSIAQQSKFTNLNFVEGSIQDFQYNSQLDVLIALHACDTATDDALYKGIRANAELIVVAPCCHKQIRKEMQQEKKRNETNFLTKHGIFMERQAEMITDGLRALYLERMGYATKVFEFISTEHTPKNVLIVAQKRKKKLNNQAEILNEIETSKRFFGIKNHHLENLLDLSES